VICLSLFSAPGFSNAYLLGPDGGGDAVLVDPGEFDAAMLVAIEGNRLRVRWVLVTHAHEAHLKGIRGLRRVYELEVWCNQPSVLDFPAHHLHDGDHLALGSFAVEVLEVPGHTLDSLCYRVSGCVFTGDTLYAGSIGRTRDGYARGLLLEGIRRKLLTLPDSTLVFPGHGPPSTIGVERRFNPLLDQKL
jgi:hydroxyacylglutathione hydrolase